MVKIPERIAYYMLSTEGMASFMAVECSTGNANCLVTPLKIYKRRAVFVQKQQAY